MFRRGSLSSRSSLRPLVGLLALTLAATACVNQGLDEDPLAESTNDLQSEAAETGTGDVDGTAEAGSGDGSEAVDLPIGAVADPASRASIEEVACAFEEPIPLAVRPTCHAVTVPEDWSDRAADNQVVLPIAVFPADEAADAGSGAEDATIYLDGGPGSSTLDLLWTSFNLVHGPQTGPRDYVTFDQRGVGQAEPSLTCPERTELELARLAGELAPGTEAGATIDATEACRDRLQGAGIDLTAYNSVASANDVEAIRSLLGYRRLNLVGVSYGTRLAQTYLRQYPASVRSVVLDSIVPVEADLWTNLAPEAQDAFEQLFRGCAEDQLCAEANPDLEARFFALLDRLDAEPIEVEFNDVLAGESVDARVDGDDVMTMVFQALYSRSAFSIIPAMVGEVEAGDHRVIEYLGSIQLTNLPYSASGMRLSVECNEEIAFESAADLAAAAPTEPGYDRLVQLDGEATLFDLCDRWPAGQAPPIENAPVVSETPTLLLSGAYDPITRPGNADVVARSLANSVSFVLPNEGHGIVSTTCGAELVAAFIDDPQATPDDACIAASPPPAWTPDVTPADIDLVEFAIEQPFQISGVRPEGWLEAGPGAFARQRTAIDPTSLIVQPTGGLVPDFVADLLGTQLEVDFEPDETRQIGGREWQTFLADDDPDEVVRLAATGGAGGMLVVLVARSAEIERLTDEVFLPVIEAATAG